MFDEVSRKLRITKLRITNWVGFCMWNLVVIIERLQNLRTGKLGLVVASCERLGC